MGKAKLHTASGATFVVDDENRDIPSDLTFVNVVVEVDKLFAFYSKPGYGANSNTVRFPSGKHDLSFSPRSARELPYKADTLLLFQHPGYCGEMEMFVDSSTDITATFPPSQAGGVSAAMNWGGDSWRLYTQINYGGIYGDLEKGDYPQPSDLPIGGDKAQSVKRL